ncbi:DUF1906 domain-containing protein [Mesorhizobium sp. M0924]|uniref:glycoside hydrolase domain-containing protein n=1 Tax=unclassified Mesorhizobium TaxID=325217 RepID=UPI003335C29B
MVAELEGLDLDISEYEYDEFVIEYQRLGGKFPIIDASSKTTNITKCLKKEGINTVIRYYCRASQGSWKIIREPEATKLIAEKLSIAVVHEIGTSLSLFSYASGKLDADYSIKYGREAIGQPSGSAIYFAIDFDVSESSIKQRIVPYFQGIRDSMAAAGSIYKIGVYGSGLTCSTLLKKGLVEFTWLAQSTGWSGYGAFKDSNLWSLLQKYPSTNLCRIGVDYNEAQGGKDFGAFSSLVALVKPTAAAADEEWEILLAAGALQGLDPDMEARTLLLIQECAKQGVKMVASGGVRTPQVQAKLWKQSRSATQIKAAVSSLRAQGAPFLADVLEQTSAPKGQHVTNALPGMSWHQWGEAVDCYWEVNGKPEWDPDAVHGGVKGYHVYADLAETKQIGLNAGGHWSSFKDWPHVQFRKAAGPKSLYTVKEIDKRMKDLYGERLDVGPDLFEPHEGGYAQADETGFVEAFRNVITDLREASGTAVSNKPYLFPDGIYKVELTLGIGGGASSEEGANNPSLAIPGSAKIMISGINKE